nr:hypothetical protein [Prevotella sp.]
MSKEKVKDLIFAAQRVISEYIDTGDSNLLDDADEILCQVLKELRIDHDTKADME